MTHPVVASDHLITVDEAFRESHSMPFWVIVENTRNPIIPVPAVEYPIATELSTSDSFLCQAIFFSHLGIGHL